MEQFDVYKKFYNMEINKILFSESEKEETAIETSRPLWVIEEERKKNGK